MPDDPRERVLLVGVDRAGVQAGRVEAVVAGGRHMLEDGQLRHAADDQADVAPGLAFVQPVEVVAGRHAGLAARTPVEVDLERELLPGTRRLGRHQGRVVPALERLVGVLVELREPLDGTQVALLAQEGADQTGIGLERPERPLRFQQRRRTSRSIESS